jgi:hypothetical protein
MENPISEPAPFLLSSHTVHAHVLIEAILVLLILGILWHRPRGSGAKGVESLTPREVDQLCDEWEPEPLVSRRRGRGAAAGRAYVSETVDMCFGFFFAFFFLGGG